MRRERTAWRAGRRRGSGRGAARARRPARVRARKGIGGTLHHACAAPPAASGRHEKGRASAADSSTASEFFSSSRVSNITRTCSGASLCFLRGSGGSESDGRERVFMGSRWSSRRGGIRGSGGSGGTRDGEALGGPHQAHARLRTRKRDQAPAASPDLSPTRLRGPRGRQFLPSVV